MFSMGEVGRFRIKRKKLPQMFAYLYKFWYNVAYIQKREGIL